MNRGRNIGPTEAHAAMSSEQKPTTSEASPVSMGAIELAGALQSVMRQAETRDYTLDIQQEYALKAIGEAFLDGEKTGYIEMATGTGKTAIESLVAEAVVQSGRRVLMLAPKISIAEQLSGENTPQPLGLSRFTPLHETAKIGFQYGGKKAKVTDDIVISTYQTFASMAKGDSNALGEFDVIIADECHRSLGQQTARAMQTNYPDAIKFGFSATPDYASDRQSSEIFETKLFDFSLMDAIESGNTAPLRTLVFETNETLALTDQRKEFTERELAPFIENLERNSTAAKLAIDFIRDGRQGIIATIPGENNFHARLMASILNEQKDIVAMEVGAHLSYEENAHRLREYQKGFINVLTFTRSLEEGWDSDVASFCINMVPTASPVRTKQLMGRVLRPKKNDIESIYVDFIDEKSGVEKQQYTALHALDLSTVDAHRILGRYKNRERDQKKNQLRDLPSINPDLLAKIMASNGKPIDGISVSKRTSVDPLVAFWERKLNEGPDKLPAELPHIVLGPQYDKARAEAIRKFSLREGLEPDEEEILEEMRTISERMSEVKQDGFARFTTRLALEDLTEDDAASPYDPERFPVSIENTAIGRLAATVIQTSLNETLSSRDASIIRLRHGMNDTLTHQQSEHTFDEIGDIFGITQGGASAAYRSALNKLRERTLTVPIYDESKEPTLATEIEANGNITLNLFLSYRQSGENFITDINELDVDYKYEDLVELINKHREILSISGNIGDIPPSSLAPYLYDKALVLNEALKEELNAKYINYSYTPYVPNEIKRYLESVRKALVKTSDLFEQEGIELAHRQARVERFKKYHETHHPKITKPDTET